LAVATMVLQKHDLWSELMEMKEAKKVIFLDTPISQAGLFDEAVEAFPQQFMAVKKQTKGARHTSATEVIVSPLLPPSGTPCCWPSSTSVISVPEIAEARVWLLLTHDGGHSQRILNIPKDDGPAN
ncbi:hypothetical protein M9458_019517, partial [Cirrhinus mrigala]